MFGNKQEKKEPEKKYLLTQKDLQELVDILGDTPVLPKFMYPAIKKLEIILLTKEVK